MKLKRIEKRGERQKIKCELESKYAEYYPHREGAKVSTIMVFIIVAMVTLYTTASFWLAAVNGVLIDPTLTTCFYAFFGTELALLAGIKTSKVFKKKHNDEEV
jgi:hypothetical protein